MSTCVVVVWRMDSFSSSVCVQKTQTEEEKESEFWIAKLKTANVVLFSLQVMPNPTMCTVQFKVDVV